MHAPPFTGIHTDMDKLRFGICGLGCMGRSHFARLRGHPNAEIVAVCDHDEDRRNGIWHDTLGNLDLVTSESGRVDMTGIHAHATPQELIADAAVDVVLITLPTALHADVALAALHARKHVLTEKPMALHVADCDRMIRAAEANHRTLMVAQCIRFWPQYETIKRCVQDGRIGAVRFAVLRRLASPPGHSQGGWLMDATQSGGALLDLHVHDVDFSHWLFGLPDTVFARGTVGPSGGIDHVLAAHSYADGRYVLIEGGWVHHVPWPFDMLITVQGERGTLGWRMSEGNDVLLYEGGREPERIACAGDALRQELDYFIDCVRAGHPVERCTPQSTRISVALAWLERRSIELRRELVLSDRLRSAWLAR